jgi:hypothetical protein
MDTIKNVRRMPVPWFVGTDGDASCTINYSSQDRTLDVGVCAIVFMKIGSNKEEWKCDLEELARHQLSSHCFDIIVSFTGCIACRAVPPGETTGIFYDIEPNKHLVPNSPLRFGQGFYERVENSELHSMSVRIADRRGMGQHRTYVIEVEDTVLEIIAMDWDWRLQQSS